MKAQEIKIGQLYFAKVNGRITRVEVKNIRESSLGKRYDVLNLATKRETTFRSAAKFKSEVLFPGVLRAYSDPHPIEKE